MNHDLASPHAALAAVELSPAWQGAAQVFRQTWQAVGNIDQFRWLCRADVQGQLEMARDELGVRHLRACAMYSPEMRILKRPLANWRGPKPENIEPNWQMVDLILEQILALGIKPMYTTCFTPPGFTDQTGTCWPDLNPIGMPRDLGQWKDFVTHGLLHHVERFGRDEMRTWLFECWNEPNLSGFFAGTKEEFFALWEATYQAVKAVDPAFRFGGPSTARGEWVPEFLDWTAEHHCLPDYIITHVYNNDSDSAPLSPFDGPASHRVKDSPHFAAGVVRGLRAELDRRGYGGEVHWNEWGRSWFPVDHRREGGLEAAFIVKTMAEVSQDADAFAFWCLSDIYDQIGFQASEFAGHYGLASLHGLRKPGWLAHVLLNRLRSHRVETIGGTELVNAVATLDGDHGAMLVYAYPESPDLPESTVDVTLRLPAGASGVQVTRLDAKHNNIIHTWQEMGAPAAPTAAQLAALRAANVLRSEPAQAGRTDGALRLTLANPGVVLVEFTR